MTGVLMRRERFRHRHTGRAPCKDTETQGKDAHVKTEAETGYAATGHRVPGATRS